MLKCCSDGCERVAVEWLRLRDLPGHVHDCPPHAAQVREWCDVTESGRLDPDGTCPVLGCSLIGPIGSAVPTLLEDS